MTNHLNRLGQLPTVKHADVVNGEELAVGDKVTAVVTGTVNGKRVYRCNTYVLARTAVEQGFVQPRAGRPAQDRIFVRGLSGGATPELIVSGSLELIS